MNVLDANAPSHKQNIVGVGNIQIWGRPCEAPSNSYSEFFIQNLIFVLPQPCCWRIVGRLLHGKLDGRIWIQGLVCRRRDCKSAGFGYSWTEDVKPLAWGKLY